MKLIIFCFHIFINNVEITRKIVLYLLINIFPFGLINSLLILFIIKFF